MNTRLAFAVAAVAVATASAIAQQTAGTAAPADVAVCAGCHGANGEGNGAGGFPRIAGQSATYLARQLELYANGTRNNPVMSPIAKQMTDSQRDVAATYYSTLSPPGPSAGGAATKGGNTARARQLANVGDTALRVQACVNCHGPDGRGEPPSYPYLAGQWPQYTIATLGEFRSGARNTDPSGQMMAIARALRESDIAPLAAYFGNMRPPPAAAAWSEARMVTPNFAPAPGSASARAGTASDGNKTGADSEQGAPTTGGGQGVGGGGANSGTNPQGK